MGKKCPLYTLRVNYVERVIFVLTLEAIDRTQFTEAGYSRSEQPETKRAYVYGILLGQSQGSLAVPYNSLSLENEVRKLLNPLRSGEKFEELVDRAIEDIKQAVNDYGSVVIDVEPDGYSHRVVVSDVERINEIWTVAEYESNARDFRSSMEIRRREERLAA